MIIQKINTILDDMIFYNRQQNSICFRHQIKSLRDFICESMLNRNDVLENHLFIEFRFKTSENINENYGNYDGQIELVKYLSKQISNSNKTRITIKSDELKNISKNIFFKEIELYKSDNTSYIPDESDYLDDEQIFDKIVITYQHNNYKELLPEIMHELTHAWDNYNSYLKETFTDLGEIASEDRFVNINKLRKYAKDNKLLNDNVKTMIQNCSHLVYSLSKVEQNAFKSEIRGELLKHEGELLTFNQAIEIFKSSRSFKDFITVSNYIDNLNDNGNDIDKETFRKFYNSINKNNWTFNKIYKKLRYQLDNYFQKISKMTAKIYFDWCESQKELVNKNLNI